MYTSTNDYFILYRKQIQGFGIWLYRQKERKKLHVKVCPETLNLFFCVFCLIPYTLLGTSEDIEFDIGLCITHNKTPCVIDCRVFTL